MTDKITDYIIQMAKTETDALGFIPAPTIEHRYVAGGQFVIAQDNRSQRLGYILHGKPTPGGVLTVAQTFIEEPKRGHGFGLMALQEVIERGKAANCRAIKADVAEELVANYYFQAAGFELTRIHDRQNRRQRLINTYLLELWPTLFDAS